MGRKREDNPLVECACGCGKRFRQYDPIGRLRRYASGHRPKKMSTLDRILSAVADGPKSIDELVDLGYKVTTVRTACSKLTTAGKLIRYERGVYGRA